MHQLADLTGLVAKITGGWAGTQNGNQVLTVLGVPSLKPYIDRAHEIVARMELLSQEDGS
jgi:hypothetical protein